MTIANHKAGRFWYTLPLLLAMGLSLSGQESSNRFQLMLIGGTNLAQIKGDPYKGFRKWGINAGIEGLAPINETKSISLGVLFSETGSAPGITERKRDSENYLDFRLTYLEVPLLLHHYSGKRKDYYSSDWQLGVSLSRLLSSRIVSTRTVSGGNPTEDYPIFDIIDRQEQFNTFSANLIVGYSRFFSPYLALAVRHHYALNTFFKPGEQDDNLRALRAFHFSFCVQYILR